MNEVELFKLLSDENRFRIFILLLYKECCICDIEERLKMKQANVSKHMMGFKKLDIVEIRKEAQWVYYKLKQQFINENPDLVIFIKNKVKSNPKYSDLINNLEQSSCVNHKCK